MKRVVSAALGVLLALCCSGCGGEKPRELTLFAMDTYMTLTAYGDRAEEALAEAGRTINELEQRLSRTREGSEIRTLNRDGHAQVSPDTADLLARAAACAAETGGAFDPTVAPLVELWGITSDSPRVPTQAEIDALLPLVGIDHLTVRSGAPTDAATATLEPGCAVDLGGVAKGYASDRVAAIFADYAITGGVVSLGGNVYVCGSRPDGQPWRVAVQDPQGEGYACTLALRDAFAVTSGGYQRYFTAPDGTVYPHIIDPATGRPARSDLLSVTVVSADGTRADAYSTALYVMGEAAALRFWASHQDDPFELVLVTADGRVVYTPGLAGSFIEQEGSSYVYETFPH